MERQRNGQSPQERPPVCLLIVCAFADVEPSRRRVSRQFTVKYKFYFDCSSNSDIIITALSLDRGLKPEAVINERIQKQLDVRTALLYEPLHDRTLMCLLFFIHSFKTSPCKTGQRQNFNNSSQSASVVPQDPEEVHKTIKAFITHTGLTPL